MIENRIATMGAPHTKARTPLDINIPGNPFASKAHITISLDLDATKPSPSYILSFSTGDEINGHVTIVPRQELAYNEVTIDMMGVTNTFVDKMTTTSSMHGRSVAQHRFLKLSMPVAPNILPEDGKLQKDVPYTFPFTFVLPEYLEPKGCKHRCANAMVKDMHLMPLPSMGDAEISGFGPHLLDDMAPNMVKVSYTIRVQIIRVREDGIVKVLDQMDKKLRIKPAFEETPPLVIDPNSDEYIMEEEKILKKGLLTGKLGKLVLDAQQPRSFRLPARGDTGSDQASVQTMVKLNLRFEPHDSSCQPPTPKQINCKLKVSTYFATNSNVDIPVRSATLMDMSQGYITEALPLASRNLTNVQWQKHESDRVTRFDSVQPPGTTGTEDDENLTLVSRTFYTTNVDVPLTLPMNKCFLPTFHSCITSRTYAINLSVSFASKSPLKTALTLKIPVQISSEGSAGAAERRRQIEANVLASEEMNDLLTPRLTTAADGASGSAELPPSYHDGPAESQNGRSSGYAADSETEVAANRPGRRSIATWSRRESQPGFSNGSDVIQSAGMQPHGFMGFMGTV